MNSKNVECPSMFITKGRGRRLKRWLLYEDILFAETHKDFIFEPKTIYGAIIENAWVIFYNIQVIQIVPQEVHSYWHLDLPNQSSVYSNITMIENSFWIKQFNPIYLSKCSHYVIEFLDHVVEIICENLIFGENEFCTEEVINQHPCLGNAFYWRAKHKEKYGFIEEALLDYRKVALLGDSTTFAESALNAINRLSKS